ncbi:MAG: phage integrase N-terminal SAM-like domain-containing protein, partial [Deltaproteobacteria bacterium]|nr:phage integrase N-terminal SAM-like domain-containing protein [Deltaproteobacteria bacterium]
SNFKDNRKNAMVCPNHPNQAATKFRVYFKSVMRRFSSYPEASRFLIGLRFKTDENTLDEREYKKNNPLGFENLALQWLEIKRREVKYSSYRKISDHLGKAINLWGNSSVKEIKPKHLQLFLISLDSFDLSPKTKHNHLSSLRQFFRWLHENVLPMAA